MVDRNISYVYIQRKQALGFILWTVMISSAILGGYNLQFQTWGSIVTLFGLFLFCIPMLIMNNKGATNLSAIFLSGLLLFVITVNLFDGDGILDAGILAYPIFILIGTLFFGKSAAPIFTFLSFASVFLIVYLEMHGKVHPTINPTRYDNLLPIGVLFLITATTVWVIVSNMEKNIRRVTKSDAELRDTYERTLEAWAKVLEIHNKENEGHSRRVVDLSIRLAHALECTEEQITNLRYGALLHDIGKLALPDQILAKPGKLDESEIEVVRMHPIYAKNLLANIPFLQQAIDVAYSHHERWDGNGYPEGKKGEQIPILARIFTVVDQWDALRSDRVYRPAWSREQTITYMKENRGKIYDPQIVDVFLQII